MEKTSINFGILMKRGVSSVDVSSFGGDGGASSDLSWVALALSTAILATLAALYLWTRGRDGSETPCGKDGNSHAAVAAVPGVQRTKSEEEDGSARGSAAVSVARSTQMIEDDDVREWLGGTRWSCRAAVSHAMLQEVMEALAEVGVLEREKLLPPASLVAGLTADVDPDLITGEEDPWAR